MTVQGEKYAHPGGDALSSILQQFSISDDRLFDITETFLREVSDGLADYGCDMAMIPTFVKHIPDGSESGTFLALDLGGTNLRVCEVHLHGDHTFSFRHQKYKVSDALKSGEATTLFDYLAESVDTFLTETGSPTCALPPSLIRRDSHGSTLENEIGHPYLPLGLTFSFPVEQTAIDSGKLLTWTKGFSAKNAIGKDVVKLVQDAFDRKHMHVRCVALVNDTVGTLLTRAYTSGGCLLGAIFGTGTNGAYVEDVSKISKLDNSAAAAQGGIMVMNTEWGAFNNSRSVLPSTPYDNKLDRESINPRKQAFEKFISGMYIGEVLNKLWGLDTALLSEIEEAWQGIGRFRSTDQGVATNTTTAWMGNQEKLECIREILVQHLELPLEAVSLDDADVVRRISSQVADRAARLSACAVAAVLVQTRRAHLVNDTSRYGDEPLVDAGKKIGVGVDGSLIELYPHFEKKLRLSLRILLGEEVERRVDIGLAKDGSGIGAALCALVAHREHLAKQLDSACKAAAATAINGAAHKLD